MSPPITGPIAEPTAMTMVLTPRALPSSSFGKASATMAVLLAMMSEPPTDCTTRTARSWAPVCAIPASSEVRVKRAKPPRYRRFRPIMSATLPMAGTRTVMTSM